MLSEGAAGKRDSDPINKSDGRVPHHHNIALGSHTVDLEPLCEVARRLLSALSDG